MNILIPNYGFLPESSSGSETSLPWILAGQDTHWNLRWPQISFLAIAVENNPFSRLFIAEVFLLLFLPSLLADSRTSSNRLYLTSLCPHVIVMFGKTKGPAFLLKSNIQGPYWMKYRSGFYKSNQHLLVTLKLPYSLSLFVFKANTHPSNSLHVISDCVQLPGGLVGDSVLPWWLQQRNPFSLCHQSTGPGAAQINHLVHICLFTWACSFLEFLAKFYAVITLSRRVLGWVVFLISSWSWLKYHIRICSLQVSIFLLFFYPLFFIYLDTSLLSDE